MKNQILSSLLLSLLISSIGAHEIPSFQSLCNAGYVGCPQQEIPFFVIRNHLILNDQMPIEQIEPTLTAWYSQNHELYSCTLTWKGSLEQADVPHQQAFDLMKKIEAHLLPLTLVDGCAILLQISKHCPEDVQQPQDLLSRCQETVRVLRKLGVKQTLSDEQLELVGQLLAIEIFSCCGYEDMQQELAILEKILATYENSQNVSE